MKWNMLVAIGFVSLCFASANSPAWADAVQLTNGDVVHGKVLSLDIKQLRLASDVHGEMIIKRDNVATIALGDKAVIAAPVPAPPLGIPVEADEARIPRGKPAGALTADEIVKQLRSSGVDAQNLTDVKKAVPLLATPEAQKYFADTVGGLTSGAINVQDVRKDALRVRGQLEELKKELGPEAGQALGSYLKILNNFIDETEPGK
jgi:hypothetical protein